MKRENYQHEIRNALECKTADEYIAVLGWCGWMEEFADGDDATQTVAVLENIHWLAHATIADIRKRTGETQSSFAKKMGIPRRTVENWEKRGACPEYLKLSLAENLGLVNFNLEF